MLKSIKRLHERNNGCTYNINRGPIDLHAFLASYEGFEWKVKGHQVSTAILERYVETYRDLLDNDDHYIGTWYDGEYSYIDISVAFSNYDQAMTFARLNNQLAIFETEINLVHDC